LIIPRRQPTSLHSVPVILVPYLFRTPPGWNLLAGGLANAPKARRMPWKDWSVAPFSINWQLTDPGRLLRWEIEGLSRLGQASLSSRGSSRCPVHFEHEPA